jgi:hypothetical protein
LAVCQCCVANIKTDNSLKIRNNRTGCSSERAMQPSQLAKMSSVAAMIGKLDATAVAEQEAARERKLAGASSF